MELNSYQLQWPRSWRSYKWDVILWDFQQISQGEKNQVDRKQTLNSTKSRVPGKPRSAPDMDLPTHKASLCWSEESWMLIHLKSNRASPGEKWMISPPALWAPTPASFGLQITAGAVCPVAPSFRQAVLAGWHQQGPPSQLFFHPGAPGVLWGEFCAARVLASWSFYVHCKTE